MQSSVVIGVSGQKKHLQLLPTVLVTHSPRTVAFAVKMFTFVVMGVFCSTWWVTMFCTSSRRTPMLS